jgi:hypothetical protein
MKTNTFKSSDYLSTSKSVLKYLKDKKITHWKSNLMDLSLLAQFEKEFLPAYKRCKITIIYCYTSKFLRYS